MKGADGNLLTCLPTDMDAAAFAKATDSAGKITDLDQIGIAR